MKTFALVFVHLAIVSILLFAACSDNSPAGLKGKWHSVDGNTKLEITSKKFIVTEDEPSTEDYFIKGDTIYTSFEGSQPSRFIIKKLDDHNLRLLYPDSLLISFKR